MCNKYFEIGKCSKKYIYILATALIFIFKNCLISLGELNINTKKNIFGIEVVLGQHSLMKLLLEYIGYIIFGIIFKFAFKNKKFNSSSSNLGVRSVTMELILTHMQTIKLVLISCCLFAIQLIVRSILNSCGVWMLDLWVFNIIFIFIFMKYFLNKETYKHQLISLIVIFSINFILLICCSSINFNEGSDYDTVKNIYGSYFYVVLFYFIFLILSALLCSSQVLQKKIMEICYISPFTILFVIGIFSGLFAFITLIITTNVSCNESLTKNKLCSVSNDDYSKDSFYFDNFSIFLINLGDQYNNNKTYFFIEIFLVYPIYAFVCFAKYFYETLVVLYLNPYYVLLSDNIFYSVRKIVTLIYNNKDTQTYLKLCGELIAIIGYCFYLEIFILGCWGLNDNTRDSITKRGLIECEDNDRDDDDSSDENDKENYSKNNNNNEQENNKEAETEMVNVKNEENE